MRRGPLIRVSGQAGLANAAVVSPPAASSPIASPASEAGRQAASRWARVPRVMTVPRLLVLTLDSPARNGCSRPTCPWFTDADGVGGADRRRHRRHVLLAAHYEGAIVASITPFRPLAAGLAVAAVHRGNRGIRSAGRGRRRKGGLPAHVRAAAAWLRTSTADLRWTRTPLVGARCGDVAGYANNLLPIRISRSSPHRCLFRRSTRTYPRHGADRWAGFRALDHPSHRRIRPRGSRPSSRILKFSTPAKPPPPDPAAACRGLREARHLGDTVGRLHSNFRYLASRRDLISLS